MAMMKAALSDSGMGMSIADIQRPEAGQGTVITRVRASRICGSDIGRYRVSGWKEALPAGHEVAGEIVEIGDGVEGLTVGDRVAIETVAQGKCKPSAIMGREKGL